MKPFGDEPAPFIGFLVRFFCGALLGAVASLEMYETDATGLLVAVVIFSIACGLASAFWGDKFWKWIS